MSAEYVPPADPSKLKLFTEISRSPETFRKEIVYGVLVLLGLMFLYAYVTADRKSTQEIKEYVDLKPASGVALSAVNNLPAEYDAIKPERENALPQLHIIEPSASVRELSELEKYLAKRQAERLKLLAEAEKSQIVSGAEIKKASLLSANSSGSYGALQEGSGALSLNERDAENRQDEKEAFLSRAGDFDTHINDSLHAPKSKYQILAGTMIPGVLLTALNSDLPGYIEGQVTQNIYDNVSGDYLLVPQFTRVIGRFDSKITYGQERVLVVWQRLIFPNGKSISIEAMAGTDADGTSGLSSDVDNHIWTTLVPGIVLGSVLGAGAQVAAGTINTQQADFGQLAAAGSAKNINEAGQEITQRNLAIQPTLRKAPGERFSIFCHKDITLEPYHW